MSNNQFINPETGIDTRSEAFVAAFGARGPRILIRKAKTKYESPSAILAMPDEFMERESSASVKGTVLQMGEQCYNLASQQTPDGKQVPWCAVGDTVYFGQYAGTRIMEEGCDDLVLIHDEDVLGVWHEA